MLLFRREDGFDLMADGSLPESGRLEARDGSWTAPPTHPLPPNEWQGVEFAKPLSPFP
jgi:hypothetical protein